MTQLFIIGLGKGNGSGMKANPSGPGTDNSLRNLVATVSEVAFEYATDAEEAYEIGCLVLLRILKDASRKSEKVGQRSSTAN